jgi:hypothetical protein
MLMGARPYLRRRPSGSVLLFLELHAHQGNRRQLRHLIVALYVCVAVTPNLAPFATGQIGRWRNVALRYLTCPSFPSFQRHPEVAKVANTSSPDSCRLKSQTLRRPPCGVS